MVDPVQRMFPIQGKDPEIDALSICIAAISEIEAVEAQARVARYLYDRFPDRFGAIISLKEDPST